MSGEKKPDAGGKRGEDFDPNQEIAAVLEALAQGGLKVHPAKAAEAVRAVVAQLLKEQASGRALAAALKAVLP